MSHLFKIVRPFKITDVALVYSTVDDSEYAPWDNATAYAVGDTRTVSNRTEQVIFNMTANTVGWVAHGGVNGDMVTFHVTSETLPPELSENFPYFMVGAAADTFQVSLTAGGAAIDISGSPFTLRFASILGESLVSAVTMTLSSTTGLPAIFTWTGHGWSNGQTLRLITNGALYTGLAVETRYYVVRATDDTFMVSLTKDGAPVKTSGTQSGTHYAVIDSHKDYECLKAVTTTSGNTPPHKLTAAYLGDATTATWLDLGATNRWRCFDGSLTSQTEATDTATYVIQTKGRFDSVYLGNVSASEVIITAREQHGGAIVYGPSTYPLRSTVATSSFWSWFFEPITFVSDFVDIDFPPYNNLEITITLNRPDETVRVGAIVVGLSKSFGVTLMGARLGIADYSVKQKDDFGNWTFVERTFAKTGDFQIMVDRVAVDAVITELAKYRSEPVVYVGGTAYTNTIIYGIYNSFDMTIAYEPYSMCNISVEGLT
jgi:hypothetical protein